MLFLEFFHKSIINDGVKDSDSFVVGSLLVDLLSFGLRWISSILSFIFQFELRSDIWKEVFLVEEYDLAEAWLGLDAFTTNKKELIVYRVWLLGLQVRVVVPVLAVEALDHVDFVLIDGFLVVRGLAVAVKIKVALIVNVLFILVILVVLELASLG